jgi:hypothetical protein
VVVLFEDADYLPAATVRVAVGFRPYHAGDGQAPVCAVLDGAEYLRAVAAVDFHTIALLLGMMLVVASLVLPYLMVFYAEFGGREHRVASDGATQGPLTETLLAYAVAFVVSAAMLAMFGRLDEVNGAATARVVTLAFPASIGAALGRMLI